MTEKTVEKKENLEKMNKLHLGCGTKILEGYENYDKYPVNDSVSFIDLEQLPYPFDDCYADEILLEHVLEHLYLSSYDVIMECYRILKEGGLLVIEVPTNCPASNHYHPFYTPTSFNSVLVNPVATKKTEIEQERAFMNRVFKLVDIKISLYGHKIPLRLFRFVNPFYNMRLRVVLQAIKGEIK